MRGWGMVAWPAGRVLPRLDGDNATPGNRLWAALRVWHVSAVNRKRLAKGKPGQLAARRGSMGDRRPHEKVEIKLNCTFRAAGTVFSR